MFDNRSVYVSIKDNNTTIISTEHRFAIIMYVRKTETTLAGVSASPYCNTLSYVISYLYI